MVSAYYVRVMKNGMQTTFIRFGLEEQIRKEFQKEGYEVIHFKKRSKFKERAASNRKAYLLLKSIGEMLRYQPNVSTCLRQLADVMNDDEQFKHILFDVIHSMRNEGLKLSVAFSKHKTFVDPVVINLLAAAEQSGAYSEAFLRAYVFMRDSTKIKEELFKQLIYPTFLVILGFTAVVVTTQYIIPSILNSALYQSIQGASTTLSFKILQIISITGLPAIGLLIALSVSIYIFFKTSQENAEKILIKTPIINKIVFYRNFTVAFYCASKLIEAMTLSESLLLISQSMPLHVIRSEFLRAYKFLKSGENFFQGFQYLEREEKYILANATPENMGEFFEHIYERYHAQYIDTLKHLGPVITVVILFSVFGLALLIGIGLFTPYGQVMNNVLSK